MGSNSTIEFRSNPNWLSYRYEDIVRLSRGIEISLFASSPHVFRALVKAIGKSGKGFVKEKYNIFIICEIGMRVHKEKPFRVKYLPSFRPTQD